MTASLYVLRILNVFHHQCISRPPTSQQCWALYSKRVIFYSLRFSKVIKLLYLLLHAKSNLLHYLLYYFALHSTKQVIAHVHNLRQFVIIAEDVWDLNPMQICHVCYCSVKNSTDYYRPYFAKHIGPVIILVPCKPTCLLLGVAILL